MSPDRLQKIIAHSGKCSRREAERLITEGRVTVNGQVAQLGSSADPSVDHIKIDGKRIKAPERLRYVLVYKPRQVMTTCDAEEERKTVIDLLGKTVRERVYPVGRLDYHSEGLLLMTNDGELAARVAHPRYGLVREYLVKIRESSTIARRQSCAVGVTLTGARSCRSRRRPRGSPGTAIRGGGSRSPRAEPTRCASSSSVLATTCSVCAGRRSAH